MNGSLFLLFLSAAVPTILSPGPGVLMSLTYCMRYGVKGAQVGILGVATGTLVVALISALGLGVLLATNTTLYMIVKFMGVLFLVYFGYKQFHAPAFDLSKKLQGNLIHTKRRRFFTDGILLQVTNPALIVFYVSLFPQCIDATQPYWTQFVVLSVIYAFLVYAIHTTYGLIATRARDKLMGQSGSLMLNRVSGVCFWLIALVVLISMAL